MSDPVARLLQRYDERRVADSKLCDDASEYVSHRIPTRDEATLLISNLVVRLRLLASEADALRGALEHREAYFGSGIVENEVVCPTCGVSVWAALEHRPECPDDTPEKNLGLLRAALTPAPCNAFVVGDPAKCLRCGCLDVEHTDANADAARREVVVPVLPRAHSLNPRGVCVFCGADATEKSDCPGSSLGGLTPPPKPSNKERQMKFPKLLHVVIDKASDGEFPMIVSDGVEGVNEPGTPIALYQLVKVGRVEILRRFVEKVPKP